MTLLDDLKALIAKYDTPVDTAPVEPAPVDTAPVDPAPADPVAAPATIGGKVAVDGQDLLAKLASAVDGDTIGLRGEFGALTIAGVRKNVTLQGEGAHFDSLKIKDSSGLTFTNFGVWPTVKPVIGSVKLFNVQAEPDTSDLVFDGLLLRGRVDSDDWVNWAAQDWIDWRMGAIWSRGQRVTARNCRAVGVQMGYMLSGRENHILGNTVFGFSDDGARLNDDNSSAVGNTITDRIMINADHPDGIQCFKTSGPLTGLLIADNIISERTQNIAPALRTHLQGVGLHNGPYAGVTITGNRIDTTSTLGISVNNCDGLLIDGNTCTHTDKLAGKYPAIRVQNTPTPNWTVTNNVAHTYILPSGMWIMKPAPGNACPVYA